MADAVQVYFTDYKSSNANTSIIDYDYCWNNCELTIMNRYHTMEEQQQLRHRQSINSSNNHSNQSNNQPINDGSDYCFVIKKINSNNSIINDNNKSDKDNYRQSSSSNESSLMIMIPLNTIINIYSDEKFKLKFQIEQHNDGKHQCTRYQYYYIIFPDDLQLKNLLYYILNEVNCFKLNRLQTNIAKRLYFIKNELKFTENNQQQINESIETFRRDDHRESADLYSYSYPEPLQLDDGLDDSKNRSEDRSKSSTKTIENVNNLIWNENDFNDLITFNVNEFDDDEFLLSNDSSCDDDNDFDDGLITENNGHHSPSIINDDIMTSLADLNQNLTINNDKNSRLTIPAADDHDQTDDNHHFKQMETLIFEELNRPKFLSSNHERKIRFILFGLFYAMIYHLIYLAAIDSSQQNNNNQIIDLD